MPRFRLTAPLSAVISADARCRIGRALDEFPELGDRTITVGLTSAKGIEGLAWPKEMFVRLNVRRRLSYFTIGHELTHLLQRPGLGIVPAGEVQCDIWTLARSELFLDAKPSYLEVACRSREWPRHAVAVRQLCQQAVQVRPQNRRYILWLRSQLQAHFERPRSSLPLFDVAAAAP